MIVLIQVEGETTIGIVLGAKAETDEITQVLKDEKIYKKERYKCYRSGRYSHFARWCRIKKH